MKDKHKVQILIDRSTKNRLIEAKNALRKTWDDFFLYLLEFYIAHSDEDDKELEKAEAIRYCLTDADTSTLAYHREQLAKILTDLERSVAQTEDPKDKAVIAEKIARINTSLKDIAETDAGSRLLEEIGRLKKNRLKILKNIAPTKTVKVSHENKEQASEIKDERRH